jgi:Collagen triple helix repeat (20 copies)
MIKRLATYLWHHHLALLALFVVLGGTSYAAVNALPKNSVGSKQVINGSLQTLDLSKKARAALKGNRGPRGFTGAPGAQGAQGTRGPTGPGGAAGSPGISGLQKIEVDAGPDSTSPKVLTPACPAGKTLISVGAQILSSNGTIFLEDVDPLNPGDAFVTAREQNDNSQATNWTLQAKIICANVAP